MPAGMPAVILARKRAAITVARPDAYGPSGGVLGNSRGVVSRDLCEKYPGLARQIVTAGQHPRAGHDRRRWETVN